MRAYIRVSIWLAAAAPGFAQDLVVLTANRAGHIEFYSPTLGKLGEINALGQLESVTASPDGARLYVARKDLVQNARKDLVQKKAAGLKSTAKKNESSADKSYGLYSLDLTLRNLCFLTAPALSGWPSADGRFLFTQAQNGVDVFDPRTLNRLSTMKGTGAYNLQPSPDGQWLLGIANSADHPSLDIFDMGSMSRARGIPLVGGPFTGAWAGDHFYLFNYTGRGTGQLWSVNPEAAEASPARSIGLPDLHGACNEPVLLMLAGAPDRLFLAEAFGFQADRRHACPNAARDGVFVIHPSSGRVNHIAASVRVNRMTVSPDGQDLYVIHSSDPDASSNIRLLHIETATGRVLQDVALQGSDWNLALAHIPSDLVPHGNLRATTYCSH
jgi:hypothetical protein